MKLFAGLYAKIKEACNALFADGYFEFQFLYVPIVCEMQHLKKHPDGAEVLILKSGQYPFITKLPDYEHLAVFEICPPATPEEVACRFSPIFFTFNEWFSQLGRRFPFPFPSPDYSSRQLVYAISEDDEEDEED